MIIKELIFAPHLVSKRMWDIVGVLVKNLNPGIASRSRF